jgi:hypothetical protein
MKKLFFFIAMLLLFSSALFAQVGINADNSAPDGSAMLDVKSTSKGALLPRMTQAQILAIQNPSNGLIAFYSTDSKLYVYVSTSSQWKEVPYGAGILGQSFPCNITFTINHIAGVVAPVNKTVAYSTMNGIPGELTKCWITSNLGADHQATAVDDATEASAGWYWQFNRKQGYKHDGTTRTPSTTWISSISETSDWIAANDPCNIELGTTWRIPTYTEWYIVDNSGGWTNWNGPWGSGLKLHAAGYLLNSGGSLGSRGSDGYFWSSTQYAATNGWALGFGSGSSYMDNYYKAYGFSARCVRD